MTEIDIFPNKFSHCQPFSINFFRLNGPDRDYSLQWIPKRAVSSALYWVIVLHQKPIVTASFIKGILTLRLILMDICGTLS